MNTIRQRTILFTVAAFTYTCGISVAAKTLSDYKIILSKQETAISEASDTKKKQALSNYKKTIDTAAAKFKKEGNLDALLAIKKEQERFASEKSAPENPSHDAVKYCKKIYDNNLIAIAVSRNKSLLALYTKYTSALEKMKKGLVKAHKIEDAIKVSNEQKLIKLKIAALREASPIATNPAPDDTKPPNRTASGRSVTRAPSLRGGGKVPDEIRQQMVLHYSFDNADRTIKDLSGNNNDGTNFGANFSKKYGKRGDGAFFSQNRSGVSGNEYVEMPDKLGDYMKIDSDFTISYWVKRNSYRRSEEKKRQGQVDITFRHGSCVTFMVDTRSSRLSFSVTQSRYLLDEVSAKTSIGKWEFWTGTRTAGNEMVLYKNGIKQASAPSKIPTILNLKESNRIGWKSWNQNISQYHPDHCIDEVMVFKRALTAQEVKKLYSAFR